MELETEPQPLDYGQGSGPECRNLGAVSFLYSIVVLAGLPAVIGCLYLLHVIIDSNVVRGVVCVGLAAAWISSFVVCAQGAMYGAQDCWQKDRGVSYGLVGLVANVMIIAAVVAAAVYIVGDIRAD